MRKSIIELCREIGLPLHHFPAGELIIEEGVRKGSLFILNEGSVEISKSGVELTDVSASGAVFGEVSQLMNTTPMATVKTLRESSFFVAENAGVLLESHPVIYYHIACLLAARLTSVISYLVDIKKQYGGDDGHLGMMDEVLESLLHLQTGQGSNR